MVGGCGLDVEGCVSQTNEVVVEAVVVTVVGSCVVVVVGMSGFDVWWGSVADAVVVVVVAVEPFTGGISGPSVVIGLNSVGAGVIGFTRSVTTFHNQLSCINFQR